jgi:hypothetical protein
MDPAIGMAGAKAPVVVIKCTRVASKRQILLLLMLVTSHAVLQRKNCEGERGKWSVFRSFKKKIRRGIEATWQGNSLFYVF